jgi:hypothetical protein
LLLSFVSPDKRKKKNTPEKTLIKDLIFDSPSFDNGVQKLPHIHFASLCNKVIYYHRRGQEFSHYGCRGEFTLICNVRLEAARVEVSIVEWIEFVFPCVELGAQNLVDIGEVAA